MPVYPHPSNTKQLKSSAIKLDARTVLFETKTVEVLVAFEARIARSIARFHATKERFECLVYIVANYLHRLAEHRFGFGECSPVANTCLLLLNLANMTFLKFPRQFAILKTHVVPMATYVKNLLKL